MGRGMKIMRINQKGVYNKMKNLKFRAWDIYFKKMFDVKRLEWLSSGDMNVVLNDKEESYSDGCELMQFTGLLDKQGKEIYEGDIVKCEYQEGVAIVKFGKGYQGEPADGMYPYWGWYVDGWFDQYAFNGDEVEVIGNIYENPELLEEK